MASGTISVAMATYNGERFLQEQLDSLARQTLLPCELVVCDDGSEDNTLGILERFAKDAPFPVRIHRNPERLGHGMNFLRAASLCSGDLIAFADQDDVWLDHKLRRCAEVISETGSVLVIHTGEVVDEELRPLGNRTASARRLTCLDSGAGKGWHSLARRLGMCPGFACVFRSHLLKDFPPKPPLVAPDRGHEYWLFFAAEAMGSITLIPDVLVFYRQHGRNTAGFHPQPVAGRWPLTRVGSAAYQRQSADAAGRARLLAEAGERMVELRPRLIRAQRWYEARAKSLAGRALLYAADSFLRKLALLFSLILGGAYKPMSRGGLGFKGLAKDLALPLLSLTAKSGPGKRERSVMAND